ncbi:hypothetical protein PENSTE_c004G03384 [Penicillium steckii]|uniref:Uncharacterized protein n=1 Tax=Penicillium steckii TaxID=303698 RepID=A0A1V6TLZ5_9EURO|nr:hypothetical protein PENSTE_c004G03384 [Penicillium steckii]
MAPQHFKCPQKPQGQWGSGPAFSQNAGFLPNQSTYGSGPMNTRNGNGNKRFQNSNRGRAHQGRNRGNQSRNGNNNNNFSDAHDQNWPVDRSQRNFNNQVRDQSQRSHFQSPLDQPQWNQYNSNQGRKNNWNNGQHNHNPKKGYFNHQENWQPFNNNNRKHCGRQASNNHAHPPFHSNRLESDLQIIASGNFPQAPIAPFGMIQSISEENDIEMPDAPPFEEEAYNYAPALEEIWALQAHQNDVDSLMWQFSNEIYELKQRHKELGDAVMFMYLRSRGVSPQG